LRNIDTEVVNDFGREWSEFDQSTVAPAELQKLFETFGNEFAAGSRNYQKELQRRTMLQSKTPDNGLYVGKIIDEDYYDNKGQVLSKIYLNPKNLQNFEPNVRAISDKDGNLFVAQFDSDFYHDRIKSVVGNKYDVYYCIHWYRIKETPDFKVAYSYKDYYRIKNPELETQCLNQVKTKHPEFNFIFDTNY